MIASFISDEQAATILREAKRRETMLDFDAIDYVNDRMELDRKLERARRSDRLRASLVVLALIAIGISLYAMQAWGGV